MAHRLLIGKGMITLNLKRIFLTFTLLPLFAVAADDCALSDPTLTVQAYTVNPQTERVKMYWQKANGEAWGTLHALLADMNSQGQVQMAMNGGIYDESYAPLGLYIENGQQKVKEKADYIAKANTAQGVSRFLKEHILSYHNK